MDKKQTRPNRILRIPRELHDCLANITYWQKESISVNDFVIELLMLLAREYGDVMAKDAKEAKRTMDSLLKQTNLMNDANNNNRFDEVSA